ncbi:hypothetical protein [Longimicrobium sp.]|uniref:hypothetical protein n=1 Tax=Longimicrobium sp. TaxID=2029185 RepID=UPI002E2F105A|nr:hypothetical protein [Longimicrobium sp.]HEX6037431.1 hypothetical protein [Longimicrobium sp.]
MGFKEYRALLIEALRSGAYLPEDRLDAREKNLLSAGTVDELFVIRLLQRCAGWEYSTSRHHFRETDCHIFTPTYGGERWYVKAYWHRGIAVVVSVHP